MPVAQSKRLYGAIKSVAYRFCRLTLPTVPVPVLGLAWVLGAAMPVLARATPYLKSGLVIHVVDGDTIWVKTSANRKPLKVRIVGIDAPESCQSGGRASHDALAQRLSGQVVTLQTASSRSHDTYGRVLAKIDLRGDDVGRWMVSSGHAWSYSYRRSGGPYALEQAEAVQARRGLFADTAAEDPRSFRKRHGSCYP